MSLVAVKTQSESRATGRESHLFRILGNTILLFTACRYFVYALIFMRGILVAKVLGPSLFGIWGFLVLVQAYLSYVGIGAHYAVNVQLSTKSEATAEEQHKMIAIALTLTLVVACLIIASGMGLQGFGIPLFEKYGFHRYALAVGIVAALNQVQQVLTNVYRVYGKLARIALVESIGAFAPLLAALIFRGDLLIQALLISTICAGIVSAGVLLVRAPFRLSLSLDLIAMKALLALGIPLMIYNASFYFITLVAQTIISIFYPVQIMGYYSLGNSVTYAILLGVNSVIWVFFPNILSRTRPGLDDKVVAQTVQRVNDLFGTAVFIVAFGSILILPLLFLVLPQYKPAQSTLTVLLLSQAAFSLCAGHNCLALARNEQMAVAKTSMIAAALVTVLCLAVGVFHLSYIWISTSVLIGAIVFTLKQVKIGALLINSRVYSLGHPESILPFGSLLAIIVCVTGCIVGYPYFGGLIGAITYAWTNHVKLKLLWNFGLQKILRSEELAARPAAL